MPSKISYVFILSFGVLLIIVGAYFISDTETRKAFILESRFLAYESILDIQSENPDEFLLEKSKIDERYETEYNINIIQREASSWATAILGALLVLLAFFDFRLYRHRGKNYETGLIIGIVEENIDFLQDKKQAEFKTSSQEKWNFDKTIFIDHVIKKQISHKLMLNKSEILCIIDKIIDGTLN